MWRRSSRSPPYVFDRLRGLSNEIVRFGVIGALGFIVDVGLFNLLRYAGAPGLLEHRPLTAKAISVSAATIVTYVGNRHWTWASRARTARHREAVLFFVFSALGLGIALGCLAVSHYVLDLRSPLADNVSANVVGLLLGMAFRFWSYRTFVFPPDADSRERDRGRVRAGAARR
jgi:putative flippase GtrA